MRKKRTPRQKAQDACDTSFSRIIRAPGRCVNCGSTDSLQCAHGFSRRYFGTRWDRRNGFCLCRGCHLKYTMRPLEWDEWLREEWGEEVYEELRALALFGAKPDVIELAPRLRELEKQLVK